MALLKETVEKYSLSQMHADILRYTQVFPVDICVNPIFYLCVSEVIVLN